MFTPAGQPEVRELDAATAQRFLSATDVPGEPNLTPEQSAEINNYIDRELVNSDMYRASEARRIILDRQWWAG
ncbi:MAG: hypothetical protein EBQ92_11180, partial [Proteobacteria bacterium]|nr:hypothetical protein [Pseudomonadota bacterium]